MAFSTRRGRPRTYTEQTDVGTPELRLKHALGITAEPIDLCLARALITPDQHWCGLHLRWLYTLRYGAPSLTSRYTDEPHHEPPADEAPQWRVMREQEYQECANLLKQHHRFEPVMRLCVFNELPAFLSAALKHRAAENSALAQQLVEAHHRVKEGLDILVNHWHRNKQSRVRLA